MPRARFPRKTFDRSAYSTAGAEPAEGEARSINGELTWITRPVAAGTVVTPQVAPTIAGAYACIVAIASDVGAMPFNVMRREKNGSKVVDWSASAQDLLFTGPNDKMTAQTWLECSVWHACTHGNAYSRMRYDGLAEVEAFDLLDPERVRPAETKSGELYYQVDGTNVPASEILHVKAPGYNGINGKSPILQNAESLGLSLAVEGYGASYFGNGIHPAGMISFDGDPDDESIEEIRKTVEARHSGIRQAHRIMTLTGGAKWTATSIKPEEAQFLLTRGYQLLEICRIFRVPPSKVQDFSRTSFASLEELNLDYYQSSLLPWLTRFEKEWLRKLYPERRKRRTWSIEHDKYHLLKGRMADQATFWKVMKELGVASSNQIAATYGLPPHDGGDAHLVQLNQASEKAIAEATLAELKGVKVEPAPKDEPAPDTSTRSTKILPSPATVDAALEALAPA